jgi:hypothetical protein
MTITDNIPFVIGTVLAKFNALENPETVSRVAASAVLPELRERIHERGQKSDGTQIGVYSSTYLKFRETPGKGHPARTSDPNVILSLTRALELSYVLAATEKAYTIGVNNPDSEKKIEWMEEKYGVIYELTLDERKIALNAANATAQIIMK